MERFTPGTEGRAYLPPPLHPSLRTHSGPASVKTRPLRPPKLLNRPVSNVHNALDSSTLTSESVESVVLPKAEEELSEAQLRELYDDEEIDRFLSFFSAYVREVRASDIPATHIQKNESLPLQDDTESSLTETMYLESSQSYSLADIDGELIVEQEYVDQRAPRDQDMPSPLSASPRRVTTDMCLSERIASDYIAPLLPAAPPPPPKFTLQRLKLTVERVYLAVEPAYGPFFQRLAMLATWQDKRTSLVYCSAYWFLWYLNLLLPSLILRILYSLIRRKALPYPTLAELRQHRHQVERAEEFSAAVTVRLAGAPTHDVQDVWHLVQSYVHTWKLKKAAKRDGKSANGQGESTDAAEQIDETVDSDTGPGIGCVDPDEPDVKAVALKVINEISDLHERLKNIFLWRRPSTSLKYGGVLVFVFLFTLLPAKYLAKLGGFICGVAFWHAVPILAALSSSDRARLPVPLNDVPTDADYAMELISQRVARGLDLKPKRRKSDQNSPDQVSIIATRGMEDGEQLATSSGIHTSVNWQKWGDRVVTTKEKTSDFRRLFQGGQWKRPENWLALNPLSSQIALPNGRTESHLQTYTFPAQYTKATGLITLTPTTLIFTSLLSNAARLSIPLADMLGVKKSGAMRGLNVRWMKVHEDGQAEEQETKFVWVGGRNELFARLIGLGGRRWAKV